MALTSHPTPEEPPDGDASVPQPGSSSSVTARLVLTSTPAVANRISCGVYVSLLHRILPKKDNYLGILHQRVNESLVGTVRFTISVSPSQRVKEFPNEELTVSNKRLFCNACREEVGLKSTVVGNHMRSKKLWKETLHKHFKLLRQNTQEATS